MCVKYLSFRNVLGQIAAFIHNKMPQNITTLKRTARIRSVSLPVPECLMFPFQYSGPLSRRKLVPSQTLYLVVPLAGRYPLLRGENDKGVVIC